MHLSTSSFDRIMATGNHTKIILLGLVSGLLLIVAAENLVRFKGGEPDVRDTAELWASQRARASSTGDNALILVGSSRIQLDLDLDVLASLTGKKPVQLAIDGSPYIEVLENLAKDESVAGTILFSTTLPKLVTGAPSLRVLKWINIYEKQYKNLWSPKVEQQLKARLQSVSALYANVLPMDILLARLIDDQKFQKIYLKTFSSRERDADFSLVKMPEFYLRRVERNLGYPLPSGAYTSYDSYKHSVVEITQQNYIEFNTGQRRFQRVKSAVNKLKARGVEVIIARFPMSGLVETIVDIRYPKALWDKVTSEFGVSVIDYRDYPQLVYELPDGSHLDMTQKREFTQRFADILLQQNTNDQS